MRATPIEIDWHSGLSIFASESFLKATGDEYGWIGGFDDSQQLRCILPYTVIRKAFCRMVRFRVETIPVGEALGIQEEKPFLNSAIEYFRSVGIDMIIPATSNAIFRTYPDRAIVAPYGTYVVDLHLTEEVLLSKLNSSHRRKLRLATQQGVQVKSGEQYLKIAYELVRDTDKRSRAGFMGYEAFKRYVLSLNENVKIFVAEHEGTAQGCIVVPFSDHAAYYAYGGSIPNPLKGATNLLHWEAIRHFRELGVKEYDFVGVRIDPEPQSKQEGLMMYKERFGGELRRGYIWKYSLHPLKYALYSQAIRVLRGGDIVDQECHKQVPNADEH